MFIFLQIFFHKASLLGRVDQAVIRHQNNSVGVQKNYLSVQKNQFSSL